MTAELLGRTVTGETREAWAAAYADVTAEQLLDHIHAATTEAEVERCEYVALLLLGPAVSGRQQVTSPDGRTTTVELHLWHARSRLGCLRSDPTVAQMAEMDAELAERRRIGADLGKARRGERTQRARERAAAVTT